MIIHDVSFRSPGFSSTSPESSSSSSENGVVEANVPVVVLTVHDRFQEESLKNQSKQGTQIEEEDFLPVSLSVVSVLLKFFIVFNKFLVCYSSSKRVRGNLCKHFPVIWDQDACADSVLMIITRFYSTSCSFSYAF